MDLRLIQNLHKTTDFKAGVRVLGNGNWEVQERMLESAGMPPGGTDVF